MALIIVILAIVFLALILILTYNSLVKLRNQVRNAWQQIDVQLKRRHDLIPNLVNSVKGYMEYEKSTLESVIQARAEAVGAKNISDTIQKEDALTAAISKLFAVAENYPNLKSNTTVMELMEELRTTENQIAFARQFYNDITTKFNTRLEIFPINLFASALKFQTFPLFEIKDAKERETPVVDLSVKK